MLNFVFWSGASSYSCSCDQVTCRAVRFTPANKSLIIFSSGNACQLLLWSLSCFRHMQGCHKIWMNSTLNFSIMSVKAENCLIGPKLSCKMLTTLLIFISPPHTQTIWPSLIHTLPLWHLPTHPPSPTFKSEHVDPHQHFEFLRFYTGYTVKNIGSLVCQKINLELYNFTWLNFLMQEF